MSEMSRWVIFFSSTLIALLINNVIGKVDDTLICFVAGVSDNHFEESLAMMYSVKQYHPCAQMLLYDLGLTQAQINTLHDGGLMKHIQIYDLPPTVHSWHREFYHGEKAVKPLFVEDAINRIIKFREHQCRYLFYLDASIRLTKPLDLLAVETINSKGILISPKWSHPQINFTHPAMYSWFGLDYTHERQLCEHVNDDAKGMIASQCMPQTHSGVFIFDTLNTTMLSRIFFPWARCAKFKSCIVPDGAFSYITQKMRQKMKSRKLYTHRADQGSYSFLLDGIVGRGGRYRDFSLPVSVLGYVQINRGGKERSVEELVGLGGGC